MYSKLVLKNSINKLDTKIKKILKALVFRSLKNLSKNLKTKNGAFHTLHSFDFVEQINKAANEIEDDLPQPSNRENFENNHDENLIRDKIEDNNKLYQNLRIGDIVYLKYQYNIEANQNQHNFLREQVLVYEGILSGDGIASNKLQCESNYLNGVKSKFQKCLFKIEAAKQFKWKKLYQEWVSEKDSVIQKYNISELEYQREKEILNKKFDEEEEENAAIEEQSIGQPVYYRQKIQLRHCYSQKIIRINPQRVSKQNNQSSGFELLLDKEVNDYSNFLVLPALNMQKEGNVVKYKDLIFLASNKHVENYIHIADSNPQLLQGNLSVSLEANTSENQSSFTIYCYYNIDQIREETPERDLYVENGEIVRVFNTYNNGYLTITANNARNNQIIKSDKEKQYIVKVLKEDEQTLFGCLWYFQKDDCFKGGIPFMQECFRLRNVMTNMFLGVNQLKQLYLTTNSQDANCLLFLKPKKLYTEKEKITNEDLFQIQSNNKLILSLNENNQEVIACSNSSQLTTVSIFKFEQMNSLISQIANLLASIKPQIYNFYSFLRKWKQDNTFSETNFTIDKALKSERELSMEVDYVVESLENLFKFISDTKYEDFSLNLKQQVLLDQGIIELLLNIAEIIHSKIYYNIINLSQNNQNDVLSTENIAIKYLFQPLKLIWNIVFYVTLENSTLSSYILTFSKLLKKQLVLFKEEIAQILIEAAGKIQSNDTSNQDITWWIHSIETLTYINAPYQCLFLQFLSNLCQNREYQPIKKNQFICNTLLLKTQKIATFLYQNSECYISFEGYLDFEEFQRQNPRLNKLPIFPVEDKKFFLLSHFTDQNEELDIYVCYIQHYLMLIASICSGRYKGALKNVEQIGLNYQLVTQCLHNQEIHSRIKTGFLSLLQVLYIDCDPLVSIFDLTNQCFMWNQIELLNENGNEYSYKRMQLSQQVDLDALNTEDFQGRVNDINSFLINFLQSGDISKLETYFQQKNIRNRQNQQINQEYILGILQLAKTMIMFGLENGTLSQKIMQIIQKILKLHAQNDDDDQQGSWVINIKRLTLNDFRKVAYKILEECIEILFVIDEIKNNESIVKYLKIFKESQQNKNAGIKQNLQQIFMQFTTAYNVENEEPNLTVNVLSSMINKTAQKIVLHQYILDFLRKCSIESTHLNIKMLKYLVSTFKQNSKIYNELRNIELIVTEKDIQSFKEIQEMGKNITEILGLKEMETDNNQVEIGLEEEQGIINREKIDYTILDIKIVLSLNLINNKFHQISSDQIFFRKIQNITRNLELHKVILKLLKFNQSKDQQNILKDVILFLTHFTQKNTQNQNELEPYLNKILKMTALKLKISRLVCNITSPFRNTFRAKEIIDQLFRNIHPIYNQAINLFQLSDVSRHIIRENLSILRSFLVGSITFTDQVLNKKCIITKLIKNQRIFDFLDVRLAANLKQKIYSNGTFSSKTLENDNVDYQNFLIQQDLIYLIAYAAKASKSGIELLKNFVQKEQIKNLLFNPNTPFLIKKPYLRLYFQLFINKVEYINQNFTQNHMLEILKEVILVDLSIYKQYMVSVFASLSTSHSKKKKIGIPEQAQIVFDQKEYSDYLIGGNSWDLTLDGLFYFILDCLVEIQQRNWLQDNVLINILVEIREKLKEFQEFLNSFEEQIKNNFMKMNLILMDCIGRCPQDDNELGIMKSNIANKKPQMNQIIYKLNSYLLKNKLNIEDISDIFKQSMYVNAKEFKEQITLIIGAGKLQDGDFKNLIQDQKIIVQNDFLKVFTVSLQKAFTSSSQMNSEQQDQSGETNLSLENQSSSQLALNYELQLEWIFKNQTDQKEELKSFDNMDYVLSLVQFLSDKSLINTENIASLQKVFKNKENNIYLLKILKTVLKNSKEQEKIDLQKIYNSAGITQLCVGLIKEGNDQIVILESLELLIELLDGTQKEIQENLLKFLQTEHKSSDFFTYIKQKFTQVIEMKQERILIKGLIQYSTKQIQFEYQIVSNFMKLLQMCCANIFTEFQDFLRSQNTLQNSQCANINIIYEVSAFTAAVIDLLPDDLVRQEHVYIVDLLNQSFSTMTQFCLGPSLENQNTLAKSKRLILTINKILKTYLYMQAHEQSLMQLDGNTNAEAKRSIMQYLDLEDLLQIMVDVYTYKIEANQKKILQEIFCFERKSYKQQKDTKCSHIQCEIDNKLIDSAFNIYLFFTILKNDFPKEKSLQVIEYKEVSNEKKKIIKKEKKKDAQTRKQKLKANQQNPLLKSKTGTNLFESEEIQLKQSQRELGNSSEYNNSKLKGKGKKEKLTVSVQEKNQYYLNNAIRFLGQFVGSLEILHKDVIQQMYFRAPFVCSFITEFVKYNIIWENIKDSDQEKIEFFLQNVGLYLKIMEHRQYLSRFSILEIFVKNWRILKDISTILIFIINIILLNIITKDNITDIGSSSSNIRYLLRNVSILQILILVICLVCCMAERYPISMSNPKFNQQLVVQKQAQKKQKGFQMLSVINVVNPYAFLNKNLGKTRVFFQLIDDFENTYNIWYLVLTVLAWVISPTIYSILLLDLVKRSEDLQNVILAVTSNYKQIVKTAILGIIVMYLYSIIALFIFSQYYQEGDGGNLYCETLLECWTGTMNLGLRSGGGIGDALDSPTITDLHYWGRYAFDLTFFIFVNIIMLNIIFGIIIDKFGDLRDKKKQIEEKVAGTCYICGLFRHQIESKDADWNTHIYQEHNVYDYLNFVIYINKKDISSCNAIEKHVKKSIKKLNIDFIPFGRAKCLEEAN